MPTIMSLTHKFKPFFVVVVEKYVLNGSKPAYVDIPIWHIHNIKNIGQLEKVTNIFFSNKRKMINKNIKKLLTQKQIKSLNQLNLKSRPSELKPEMYYKIAKLYEKIK